MRVVKGDIGFVRHPRAPMIPTIFHRIIMLNLLQSVKFYSQITDYSCNAKISFQLKHEKNPSMVICAQGS